jgi:two-component system, chemotaxis family, chemotaxis protein CheY
MARILVIDDASFLRAILRRFLESAGHEVIEAEDGEQGVGAYRQARPELVISDVVMPKKDGLATLRELRELNPQAKVITISGGGARVGVEDWLEKARAQGANATLAKPFEREVIVALVERILSESDDGPRQRRRATA